MRKKILKMLLLAAIAAAAHGEEKFDPDKGNPKKGILPVPQNPKQEAGKTTPIMPHVPKDYKPQRKDNYKLRIETFPMDEQNVYEIPVRYDDGVTTFMFPSKITGIDAANVTRQPLRDNTTKEVLGDFLISYTEGSHYFSIVALRKNAKGSLNVKYNKKTYVIRIYQDDTKDPYATVTFTEETETPGGIPGYSNTNRKRISPLAIAGCMDIAKGYHMFKKHHPQRLKDVAYMKMNIINNYKKFNVKVDETFRFDREDTIVFRLLLENLTDEELSYEPDTMAVRLGNVIYYASMADASGKMAPRSITPAYFAITGTPTGGRNNLKLENKWNVIVSTKNMEYNPYTQIKNDADEQRRKELEEMAFELANTINGLPNIQNAEERDKAAVKIRELTEKIQKLRQPESKGPENILRDRKQPEKTNAYGKLNPEEKNREFEKTAITLVSTINALPMLKTKNDQDNAIDKITELTQKIKELKESGAQAAPDFEKTALLLVEEIDKLPYIQTKAEQDKVAANITNLTNQIQNLKQGNAPPPVKNNSEKTKKETQGFLGGIWSAMWPFGGKKKTNTEKVTEKIVEQSENGTSGRQ